MRKNRFLTIFAVAAVCGVMVSSCSKDDDDPVAATPGPGTHSSELLVAKFATAPTMDGAIDAIWGNARTLVSKTNVPTLGERMTYLNSGGAGVEETLDLFFPYTDDADIDFQMRSGYVGEDIYFLLEWKDDEDSKDRQSWYFNGTWKQENKYANAANDKFYEDKFAFLFPNGDVDGFEASTCYATCHTVSSIATPKDKHTRHYLKTDGQKIDMWHWKRVRGTYNDKVDDQRISYVAGPYDSGSNGRGGDADGSSGYSDNKADIGGVSVPKYVVPGGTDYYWISEDDLGVTAFEVTAVDANGVLTYAGGTIDPADGGYEQGTGVNRFPSIITRAFTGGRADISVKANYTGTGWVVELHRKMNTGDVDDVVFDKTAVYPFGFAIFDNAAIAHSIKPGLSMKFAQ